MSYKILHIPTGLYVGEDRNLAKKYSADIINPTCGFGCIVFSEYEDAKYYLNTTDGVSFNVELNLMVIWHDDDDLGSPSGPPRCVNIYEFEVVEVEDI